MSAEPKAQLITFEQMKAFLVQRYKHDRLYGMRGWEKEGPGYYGDYVVQGATDDLNTKGWGAISHWEAVSGKSIWYTVRNGEIVETEDDAEIKGWFHPCRP